MKGFIKKIICFASIFGVIICTITYAGNLVKKVYFSIYPIYIDGEEYASESPILSYQDRTYVSLREFSNMIGVDVDFKNNIIYLSTNSHLDKTNSEDKTNIKPTINSESKVELAENSPKVTVIFDDDEVSSQTVYITESGTKYHSSNTCSGGTTFSTISLQEAKKRGYLPCSKCVNNL